MRKSIVASVVILLFVTLVSSAWETAGSAPDSPVVVKFVAPPYPSAMVGKRIQGKVWARMRVEPSGQVKEVEIVKAYPAFADPVKQALTSWEFLPTDDGYDVELQVEFRFMHDDCFIPPAATETYVSAELPRYVLVETELACITTWSTKY